LCGPNKPKKGSVQNYGGVQNYRDPNALEESSPTKKAFDQCNIFILVLKTKLKHLLRTQWPVGLLVFMEPILWPCQNNYENGYAIFSGHFLHDSAKLLS